MNKQTIARLTTEINALKAVGASTESITQARHALIHAVKSVVGKRLQNRRSQSRQKRTGRLCLTCKANIDNRTPRATYCESCANKRREEKEREYRKKYDTNRGRR